MCGSADSCMGAKSAAPRVLCRMCDSVDASTGAESAKTVQKFSKLQQKQRHDVKYQLDTKKQNCL